MVRKPDIQYVDKFYVHGSEARVLELKPQKKKAKTVLPKFYPTKETVVRVDALSMCALTVAVTLVVLMVVGCFQMKAAYERYEVMNDYVISLQNENVKLQKEYYAGFDAEDIGWKAHALGMIPVEEAQAMTFSAVIAEEEPAPTMWEDMVWFLKGLLA